MDFVTGLPPSKCKGVVCNAILIVVDQFTKMVRYIPVSTTIDAAELAEVFHSKIVCCYGMPDNIVSDWALYSPVPSGQPSAFIEKSSAI